MLEKIIKYYTMRRFGTTIHVMEVPKGAGNDFIITACIGDRAKRQPLTEIKHKWLEDNGHKRIGGINGGFFDNTRILPYGLLYIDSGFLLGNSWVNDSFLELIHQDGRLHIDDVAVNEFKSKYPRANWAISLSYSLIIDGKINIRNKEKFSWANTAEPRTLFGDNAEKYIFVVTEGRLTNEKGLTADESAQLMLELGCKTAINADGGGSSAMDLEGRIQNKYYANRALTDGILIYARPGVKYKIERGNGEAKKNILFIGDPGHGGSDRANRGATGYIEADGVLDVALFWKTLMEKDGYKVKLTREIDKTLSLYDRAEMANGWSGNFLISFHTNAGDPSAHGIETFYTLNNEWGNKQHSEEAKRVATIVQRHMVQATGLRDRGTKTRLVTTQGSQIQGKDFYAMTRRSNMPAIIVEMGFHTNSKEEALLKTKEFRLKLAEAIHAAVREAYPLTSSISPVTTKKADTLEVTASALRVRTDKMGEEIGMLHRGDIVEKIGEHPDKDWHIVRKGRLIGFVSADFLK